MQNPLTSADLSLGQKSTGKQQIRSFYGAIAVFLVIIFTLAIARSMGGQAAPVQETAVPEVKTITFGQSNGLRVIDASGLVKADSKIDVVTMTRGTVQTINFERGQEVTAGTVLATLNDDATMMMLNNAEIAYANVQNSYNSTESLLAESLKQADAGVKNASSSLQMAELSLSAAKKNYDNSLSLQEKSNLDLANGAIIAYKGNLKTVFSVLNQINYLIKEEGSNQLAGVDQVLGVLNETTVTETHQAYIQAKAKYTEATALPVSSANALTASKEMVELLNLTEKALSNTIILLDNTVSYAGFSDTTLNTQKTTFNGLHATIVGLYAGAERTQDALQNIDFYNEKELIQIKNAVDLAEQQRNMASESYQSALTARIVAEKNQTQQRNGARLSLDSALGQLNLARIQANNLILTASINGQITYKNIEIGTEMNPGTKVAEVSQLGLVKVAIEIPVEDVKLVSIGQEAFINTNLPATVTSIGQSADPVSKKVLVEVTFDNKNKQLVPNTPADVTIIIDAKKTDGTSATRAFLPLSAVTIGQNEQFVLTVVDGVVKKVVVVTGELRGDEVEIVSGLIVGDNIITDKPEKVQDGSNVSVVN